MPIESPILNDLDFKKIEALLRNKIPIHAPEWTDHNESDPGITLIQLFAYLAEQIGYRLNRVPEKNYIEFLKLIGIRLRPAASAVTAMNFILTRPETAPPSLIPAATRIKAKSEDSEPPVFETDVPLDVVPAQLAALVTTRSNVLTQINSPGEAGPGTADPESYIAERFSVAWDGKKPKLKDMPGAPVQMFHRPEQNASNPHMHLWIGLAFNPAVTAGFLGARVTLRLQLDDDEQPAPDAVAQCGGAEPEIVLEPNRNDPLVACEYYRPAQINESVGSWQPLQILGDTTEGWLRSGQLRFDAPSTMGAIPDAEWEEVQAGLPHPLVGALKNPVQGTPDAVPISGWIHLAFQAKAPAMSLRALSFNVVSATNAETVRGEQLGRGDSQPNQRVSLASGNVLPASLKLVTQEQGPDLVETEQAWTEIESFDTAGPFDRVYVLDPEAGEIVFGDGVRGFPPGETERIVARAYRHGGGKNGEVDVGMVNQPDSLPSTVETSVNIVAARGGRDAETPDEAKLRAPIEIKVQERAVTAEDFEFHALRTTGVRVGRAKVVPLRIPYPEGEGLPQGLDLTTRVPGALSVIVVPDEEGMYPTPTEGMLRTVCRHLDGLRLVTTEVYTVAPQYVRLFDFTIDVKAAPGFTRTQLREAIAERLESYFHILHGGPDGSGFPFGATVHHADLVAQVIRVQGVDRVERLEAWFDGNTPANVSLPMTWRTERLTKRRLINCVTSDTDDEKIVLLADEAVFVDATTLNINIIVDS